MLVFVEVGKPEYPEKNPRSRVENQQQKVARLRFSKRMAAGF